MVVDFGKLKYDGYGNIEKPIIKLINQDETIKGILSDVYSLKLKLNFNDLSEVTFSIPYTQPLFDSVVGFKYIEIEPFGKFVLTKPVVSDDGVKRIKECTAYSLEYEFSKKQIYISKGTYNFYDRINITNTVIQFITELMPNWSIGDIDDSVCGRYRTFDVVESNLYEFMMNTLQQIYNVCFVFDTANRIIHVKEASNINKTVPIYLSLDNLIKNIKVEELSDDIVTCLNVHGADGVDIRSANPLGTNKIYNLDYFMYDGNISESLKEKWIAWESKYQSCKEHYNLVRIKNNINYTAQAVEKAKLIVMQTEMDALKTQQSVIVEGVAENLIEQSKLDEINANIDLKYDEVMAQTKIIESYNTTAKDIEQQSKNIIDAVAFQNNFTENEIKILQNYIKEDSLQDTTFVATTANNYSVPDIALNTNNALVTFSGFANVAISYVGNYTMYDFSGGTLSIVDGDTVVNASVIRGVLQINNSTKEYVMSMYMSENSIAGTSEERYESGTLSMMGKFISFNNGQDFTMNLDKSTLYITRNVTEYQRQSVESELFDYSTGILKKISEPSFSFEVDSVNFLFSKEYDRYKNSLELGSAVYLRISDNMVVKPILLTVNIDYENPSSYTMTFNNKFRTSTGAYAILDIINDLNSSSRSADFSKYNYNDYVTSGANSAIKTFMNSALDASKNALIASNNMNVTFDGTGLHLQKWNEGKTGFYDEQIWALSNLIAYTDDGWKTVKQAIGKFTDANLGSCWGIVAPNIVGTLLAGSSLVIESKKEDGGISQFKVDSDGVRINNGRFTITSDGDIKTQIVLDPTIGIALGEYGMYTINPETNSMYIDKTKSKFYVEQDTGNLVLKGKIYASAGEFTGKVVATEGSFTGEINAQSGIFKGTVQASKYLDSNGVNMFNENKFTSDYLNLKGTTISNQLGQTTFKVDSEGNVTISGNITMNGGNINWGDVSSDPKIDEVKNETQNAKTTAENALHTAIVANEKADNVANSLSGAYTQAADAWTTAIKLADGTLTGHTFIDGNTIKSPNIIGGTITSETTINVGTDVSIGNNLYMMANRPNETGSINFGGSGRIMVTPSQYGQANFTLAANSNIALAAGGVNADTDFAYTQGDVIIKGNTIRLGYSNGGVYINQEKLTAYGGKLYINDIEIGFGSSGGGNYAVFA